MELQRAKQKKERKICFIYHFLHCVFCRYMPHCVSTETKYKVLTKASHKAHSPIVSMQPHSPPKLKFSLPEHSGGERGCQILLWQENKTTKLMDKSLVHVDPSAVHHFDILSSLETSTHIDEDILRHDCWTTATFALYFRGSHVFLVLPSL